MEWWRAQGHRLVLYLDDGLFVFQNLEEANTLVPIVRQQLRECGFLDNEKSQWEPTQKLTWLSFVIDLGNMTLSAPQDSY